jgi:hypothetical protein
MTVTEPANSSKRGGIVEAQCRGASWNACNTTGTRLNKYANSTTMPARQKQSVTSDSISSLLTGKLSRLSHCNPGDATAINVIAHKMVIQNLRNIFTPTANRSYNIPLWLVRQTITATPHCF